MNKQIYKQPTKEGAASALMHISHASDTLTLEGHGAALPTHWFHPCLFQSQSAKPPSACSSSTSANMQTCLLCVRLFVEHKLWQIKSWVTKCGIKEGLGFIAITVAETIKDEIDQIVLLSSWQMSPSVIAASPPLVELLPLLVLMQGQDTTGNRPGSA